MGPMALSTLLNSIFAYETYSSRMTLFFPRGRLHRTHGIDLSAAQNAKAMYIDIKALYHDTFGSFLTHTILSYFLPLINGEQLYERAYNSHLSNWIHVTL